MGLKSIIFVLQPPAQLSLSELNIPLSKPLKLDEIKTNPPSFPPWPVLADLLIHSEQQLLVGIFYPIPKRYWQLAQRICSTLDSKIIRYNSMVTEKDRFPYRECYGGEGFEDFHVIEFVWSDLLPDSTYPAQLDDGCWYFSKEGSGQQQLCAFGLDNIDFILKGNDLVFPDSFSCPFFVPEFVENQESIKSRRYKPSCCN